MFYMSFIIFKNLSYYYNRCLFVSNVTTVISKFAFLDIFMMQGFWIEVAPLMSRSCILPDKIDGLPPSPASLYCWFRMPDPGQSSKVAPAKPCAGMILTRHNWAKDFINMGNCRAAEEQFSEDMKGMESLFALSNVFVVMFMYFIYIFLSKDFYLLSQHCHTYIAIIKNQTV